MRITFIIFLLLFTLKANPFNTEYVMKEEIPEDITFSKENLKAYIKELGILYPKVVLAQARIESSNFTSRRFIENNNIFGMKYPVIRETTAIGIDNNHSVYTSWKESVNDYKLWQDFMIHRASNRDEYISYLGKNYAKDKRYTLMIKQIIWKLDSQKE